MDGCNKSLPRISRSNSASDASAPEKIAVPRRYAMSQQETYQEKLEAQLKEWGAQIEELKTKAEQATAELSQKYREQIEELWPKQEEIQKRLHDLKDTSEAAWQEFQGGLERAWQELRAAIEKASAKFKEPKS